MTRARSIDDRVRVPTVSLGLFRRLATAAAASYALLVVTGGAVRLTGSGLGCPDWPTCSGDRITSSLSFHPAIEFSNRLVTVVVSVLSVVVLLAAYRLPVLRRDLRWLSGALFGGLLAQVVLGGLVVLFKLNPYLVALHFLLTLGVLGIALVLRHHAISGDGPTRPTVGRELTVCSKIGLLALSLLLTLGTVTTGSGPHAGAANAHRIHLAFRDAAELHSSVALFVIGLVLALLFGLRQAHAPASVQRNARVLLEILAIQGVLGYTQYALHDAGAVVELHLAGATAVWCAAVSYALGLRAPLAPTPIEQVASLQVAVRP